MALTQSDVYQIEQAVARASAQQQKAALSSKRGLINFLSLSGLTFLAQKLWDYTWNAIAELLNPSNWF